MINTILVAIHPHDRHHIVLLHAIEMVRRCPAALHLVCVRDLAQYWEFMQQDLMPDVIEAVENEVETFLAAAQAHLARHGIKACVHIEDGAAAKEIALLAQKINADLILIGHRHLSWLRGLIEDSVEKQLIKLIRCSLMIVIKKPSTAEEDERAISTT